MYCHSMGEGEMVALKKTDLRAYVHQLCNSPKSCIAFYPLYDVLYSLGPLLKTWRNSDNIKLYVENQ